MDLAARLNNGTIELLPEAGAEHSIARIARQYTCTLMLCPEVVRSKEVIQESQKSKPYAEGLVQRTTWIARIQRRTHSDTPRQYITCVWAVANGLVGFRCIGALHASPDTDVESWRRLQWLAGKEQRRLRRDHSLSLTESSYTALCKPAMDDCPQVRLYKIQHERSNFFDTTDSIVSLCTPLIVRRRLASLPAKWALSLLLAQSAFQAAEFARQCALLC